LLTGCCPAAADSSANVYSRMSRIDGPRDAFVGLVTKAGAARGRRAAALSHASIALSQNFPNSTKATFVPHGLAFSWTPYNGTCAVSTGAVVRERRALTRRPRQALSISTMFTAFGTPPPSSPLRKCVRVPVGLLAPVAHCTAPTASGLRHRPARGRAVRRRRASWRWSGPRQRRGPRSTCRLGTPWPPSARVFEIMVPLATRAP
jgi:hypothetical protein